MIKIRDMIPSKGYKRYRRVKPLCARKSITVKESIRYESPRTKVKRMLTTLKKTGWTFKFTVEVVSPRGFRYGASGASGDTAVLNAFGQWQRELAPVAPKLLKPVVAPPVVVMRKVLNLKRKYHSARELVAA